MTSVTSHDVRDVRILKFWRTGSNLLGVLTPKRPLWLRFDRKAIRRDKTAGKKLQELYPV